ncbi:MAG TPA: hypothetical protein VHD38_00195 [Candidatus Paceibacterota bacterium]|nr:hypothetical protein [Candidatus Paceibacterota bacterium]
MNANRIDPIFSIDGTDHAALTQSLSVLRAHEDQFLVPYFPEDRARLNAALYPWRFLQLLPETQDAREQLLATPSFNAAANYSALLRRLTGAYIADAESLADGIRASTSTDAQIAFPGQMSNESHFIGSLEELSNSARAQRAKAEQRFHCLLHFGNSCERIQTLLAKRAASISIPDAVPAPTEKDYAMDAVLKTVNDRILPKYADRDLPPLIAMQSKCLPYPQLYVRTWWQTLPEGGYVRKASITNDMYLDIIMPQQNQIYAKSYALGARLKYQISGHYYLCPDAGIDVAREQGALSVYSILIQGPIITDSSALDDLEKKIQDQRYIDTHDVAEYVHGVAALIANEGYASLQFRFGDDSVAKLEEIIALWRGGAANFDEVIREAASENDYLWLYQRRMPIFPVFITRSFASVFLQDGNPSFVPAPISFATEVRAHPLSSFRMVSYNDLIGMGSTSSEIIDQVFNSFRIERQFLPH